MKVLTKPVPHKIFDGARHVRWYDPGKYECRCGEVFEDSPDDMCSVACPACGQECDAFNGTDFVSRREWGYETGESFY